MKLLSELEGQVFVATACHGGKAAGCTLTWVMPASLGASPPRLLLAMSRFNDTHAVFRESGKCCLNLLSEAQVGEFFTFATGHSFSRDKFSGVPHVHTSHGVRLEGASGFAFLETLDVFDVPDRAYFHCAVALERRGEAPGLTLGAAMAGLSGPQRALLGEQRKRHALRDDKEFSRLVSWSPTST